MAAKRDASGAEVGHRARAWCFTVYNEGIVNDPEPWTRSVECVYLVCQRELCPTTGRPHMQGYVYWKAQRTRRASQRALRDEVCRMVPAKGTGDQNKVYCTKQDTRDPRPGSGPFEKGTVPAQGSRGDLDEIRQEIDSGSSDKDIATAHFGDWCRYHKAFDAYRTLGSKPRAHQTICVVLWGPPGTGKTRGATAWSEPEDTFWLPRPAGLAVWWDGYAGHGTVVVDEFYGWIRRDTVQRLVDRTPLRVEVKGGSLNFIATTVIFTSNKHPKDWWPRVGLGAMQRRLEEPIGCVMYCGNEQFPDADAYMASDQYAGPQGAVARAPGYVATSDDVALNARQGEY